MRVKRYVVDSMPDALHKIRSELGKDAVILNTKEIKIGGLFGFFGKKRIEVIAATDTAAVAPAPSSTPAPLPVVPSASGRAAYRAQSNGGTAAVAAQPEPSVTTRDAAIQAVLAAAGSAQQERLHSHSQQLNGQSVATADAPPAVSAASARTADSKQVQPARSEDQLLEEIRQMKEMMLRLSKASSAEPAVPDMFSIIKDRLLRHEVEEELARRLIEEAIADLADGAGVASEQEAENAVRARLKAMTEGRMGGGIGPQTRIVHFVGPTGVGKTTTIAKLAAEQVLKNHRKVGFITSDTYRIAAVEQLRTYANILNVPFEVVFSPQDLPKAFQALDGCDMIFMDTAGRNFRNELYVSELNTLLQTDKSSETYLVLSLTAKYKDMKVITENFSRFKLDKVLFTKADETDSYGSIYNLLYDFPLSLSYIANGQNVPDDIALLNENRYIDAILEDRSHE